MLPIAIVACLECAALSADVTVMKVAAVFEAYPLMFSRSMLAWGPLDAITAIGYVINASPEVMVC